MEIPEDLERVAYEEKKARALTVLTDDTEQLGLNAFRETSRLVGTFGDNTTRLLLLYTTIYHRDEIVPYLREGMRLNQLLDFEEFETRMSDMRKYRREVSPPVPPFDRSVLFVNKIFEFAWRMETRLWESKAVCLRGSCEQGRNEMYIAVLRILEIRWRTYNMLPAELQEGGLADVVDTELSEQWVRGLLPTSDSAQAASDRMRAARGLTTGEVVFCHNMCKCDERKREARLGIYFPNAPNELEHNPVRQRLIVRVVSTLPPEDVADPEEEDELQDLFDLD